jgi:peptidoglycan/LPS O-acetylase OafA/YrhL
MSDDREAKFHHLSAVDGLRGAACLAVLIHHCYVHCGRYACGVVHAGGHEFALSRLLFYGYGGVEVFFVLSGFCLAYPYFARIRPDGWGRYFAKRAARILPPYYAAALALIALSVLLHFHPLPLFGSGVQAAPLPTAKDLFVCFSLLGASLNPSFWTLALEARWYFALPLLILAWKRSRLATALVVVLLSVAALHLNGNVRHFEFLVGDLLLYLPTFLLGIYAAHLTVRGTFRRHGPSLRWLVLAALVLLVVTIPREPDGGFFTMARIVPWSLFAWSLLLAVIHDPIFGRIARSKPLVSFGMFSYSLYVIHEPLVHFVDQRVPHEAWSPWTQFLFFEGVLGPVCVGVGYLFYRAVERPTQRWAKAAFSSPPIASRPDGLHQGRIIGASVDMNVEDAR